MSDKTQIDSQESNLDSQINEALANTDDNGKLQFGDEVDPLFKRAVLAEKKARDNQASFTKGRQELAELRAAKEVLEKEITSTTRLTAEQVEELDDLKYSDPDQWYTLKGKYEKEGKEGVTTRINETVTAATEKAVQELTLAERTDAVKDFAARTGITLTDDVMMNDIPPRLQAKMGSMPFDDYLKGLRFPNNNVRFQVLDFYGFQNHKKTKEYKKWKRKRPL